MMQKWSFAKRKYEPYKVPADWKVKTYSDNMDEIVNCAECGKEIDFGSCCTSRKIHTGGGFGFAVCPMCFEKEVLEEQK